MRLDQALQVFRLADRTWLEAHLFEMPTWGIDERKEEASFLAQIGHETRGFTKFEESLNYMAPRLAKVWPRRFYLPPDEPRGRRNAIDYAGRPKELAEFVYGGRMENGPEGSGDGWKYRGQGSPQLTGKRNYRLAQEALGIALLEQPGLMLTPTVSARVAGWFWRSNGMDAIDDDEDIREETLRLNGGDTGLAERERYFQQLLKLPE